MYLMSRSALFQALSNRLEAVHRHPRTMRTAATGCPLASRRRFITSAILLSGLPTPELMSLTKQASQRSLPLLGYLSKPLNKDELEKLIGLTFTPPT